VDEFENRAESLRLKLQSRRDSRRRVPEELRAEAVAFARARHASGERYKSIARTRGLKPDTLMRWCRRGREPNKFARVVVK
jgi:transposase-like protein